MDRGHTLARHAALLVPAIVLLLGVSVVAVVVRGSATAGEPPSATTSPDLGPLAQPETGTHTYEVTSERDGEPSAVTETRVIRALDGRPGEPNVEVTTTADGRRQQSRLAWTSGEAVVHSTAISTAEVDAGTPCTWDPPFPEFGAIEDGSSWTVDSTCRTEIDGFQTTIEVDGTTSVLGSAEIDVGGRQMTVWELERDRSTSVTSMVGEDVLDQTVREQGTVYLDPKRGLVVRSEMRVTVSGARAEEYDRQTVLVESSAS